MSRFVQMVLFSVLAATSLAGCKGEIARQLPSDASRETKSEAKLCEHGDLVACHNVAVALEFSTNPTVEQQELAHMLYLRACDNGVALSCRRLADRAASQPNAAPDAGEAILVGSCSRGDVDACVQVANGRIERGLFDDGMGRLLDLCHQRSSRACMELGRHYLEGTSGHTDFAMADRLLEGPCAQGSPVACRMRAEAQLAQATSADTIGRTTIVLLGEACLGSDVLACRRLAGLYHAGVGVEQDDTYAAALLKNACAFGPTVDCDVMIPAPVFAPAPIAPSSDHDAADAAFGHPPTDGTAAPSKPDADAVLE